MMNLLYKLSFLLILLAPIHSVQAQDKITNYIDRGAPLPSIHILDRAGVSFTAEDAIEGRNFIIILFNPTCGHCIDAGKLIQDNKSLFKNNTIFFLTDSSLATYFPHFVQETGWEDDFNLILGTDGDAIRHLYNDKTLPQINIYSPDRTLIRSFNGYITLEQLNPYIQP